MALHNGFGMALQMLTDFYASKSDPEATIAALTAHLQDIAWHRANVAQFIMPEFEFLN